MNRRVTRSALTLHRRHETARKRSRSEVSDAGVQSHLSRFSRSRLAILVHQGSDPTLPYQTLVTRESARLFQRLCALGTNKTFSAPSACYLTRGQHSLMAEIVPFWPSARPAPPGESLPAAGG